MTTSPPGPPSAPSTSAARSLAALAWQFVGQWRGQLLALAVACGVVAATIAGAIGVGDALQNGLRRLALERLGGIDATLVADDFFRAALPHEAVVSGVGVVPAIVLEVVVEAGNASSPRTARATLLACQDAAALGFEPPAASFAGDQIAINDVLAEALDAQPGDVVVLR